MRLLLADGAGAVGWDLTSALLGMNHEVRFLDTHADTLPISGHEKLELIRGRVEDRSLADKAVKDRDMVIHLAWSFSDDPGDLVESDLRGPQAPIRVAALLNLLLRLVHKVPLHQQTPLQGLGPWWSRLSLNCRCRSRWRPN